jgi:hypothetical protein
MIEIASSDDLPPLDLFRQPARYLLAVCVTLLALTMDKLGPCGFA